MLAESTPTATAADPTAPALRDGYELHRAALRHGLNVTLYPRQVLMASPPAGGTELTFVHGIPKTSTLAAVTYAQDKRMRRELLVRAGLPVPEGGTFAIGRELAQAKELAREIGYPVVVKPAVGDNLAEVFAGLRDEQQLDAAIEYLRTPELERPTFTRTAYALTLLLEPDEEDGRSVAPAGYQFLLERHVPGEYVHVMVLGDDLLAAVYCPGGPAGPAGPAGAPGLPGVTGPNRDVTDELHPSIAALAVEAAQTIPGLAVAAVDIVLADHRQAATDQQLWIVDFAERPLLAAAAGASEALSHRLGEAILSAHAAESAVTLAAPRDEVSVAVQVEGATDPHAVAAAIGAAAEEHGLTGTVSVADPVEGTAEGSLRGAPGAIAWIIESLLDGQLHGQRAMLVEAAHNPPGG